MKMLIFLLLPMMAQASMFEDCLTTQKLIKDKKLKKVNELVLKKVKSCAGNSTCLKNIELWQDASTLKILKEFRSEQRACFRAPNL